MVIGSSHPQIYEVVYLPLGVPGICLADDTAMMKGGKVGVRIDPAKIRTIVSGAHSSECEDIEWRDLSSREARKLTRKGGDGVNEASGASAVQKCTASSSRGQMVSLCAVKMANGMEVGPND